VERGKPLVGCFLEKSAPNPAKTFGAGCGKDEVSGEGKASRGVLFEKKRPKPRKNIRGVGAAKMKSGERGEYKDPQALGDQGLGMDDWVSGSRDAVMCYWAITVRRGSD